MNNRKYKVTKIRKGKYCYRGYVMTKYDIHTYPRDGWWEVVVDGENRVFGLFASKKQCISAIDEDYQKAIVPFINGGSSGW